MVNFMIVLPIWFYDKYKEARLEYKKRQEEVQRANEGLMSGMKWGVQISDSFFYIEFRILNIYNVNVKQINQEKG